MDKLISLSEKYENYPLVRVIINAIPYIGNGIDIYLTNKWNKFQIERFEDFIDKLSSQLSCIQQNKLDKNFLESEEFFDIVYSIVKDVINSRLEEKRTIYAKILKDSLENEQIIYDLELLIKQVEEIKEKDLVFIKYIQEFNKIIDESITGERMFIQINDCKNFDIDEITRMLYRFTYLGLLNNSVNILTTREKMTFTTTRLFSKLCNYICE